MAFTSWVLERASHGGNLEAFIALDRRRCRVKCRHKGVIEKI